MNFKRWQQKMHFYMTTLHLDRFRKEEVPLLTGESNTQTLYAVDAWKHSDYICQNYVLNCLDDSLDNVIIHKIHAERMITSESFQVAAVIEKLPPAWKMFKNYLKHKRKEMTMEDLILRLHIEEDNRGSEKNINVAIEKTNMVEHVESSKPKKTTSGKGGKLAPKGGISKSKFQEKFYNCDIVGHKSSDCKKPKKANKKKKANMLDHISKDMGDIDLCVTISEVNMVGSNPLEWWIDTGAPRHIFSDKAILSSLKASDIGEKLYMGNEDDL
ncbi:uncharacterized protein LOC141685927 [Apium graveolens]|uniref:uncharacterized protein LOC141685927 n=1 Tax=Apium graveolens TaxID=4045 RepID=UPI003D7AB6DD